MTFYNCLFAFFNCILVACECLDRQEPEKEPYEITMNTPPLGNNHIIYDNSIGDYDIIGKT